MDDTYRKMLLVILTCSLCWTYNREQTKLSVFLLKSLREITRNLEPKAAAINILPGKLS